jgi:hypothetical protein
MLADVGACTIIILDWVIRFCMQRNQWKNQALDNETPILDIKPLIVSLHYQYKAK